MSAPFSVALPNQLQRRGEIIGIICGALCFPFAFFGGSLGRLFPDGPAGIILPIVLFSAFAGIIACLFGTRKEAEEMAGFAPRVGVRAGLVATLVGGALTVLAASFHSLGIGSPNPNSIASNIFSLVLPSYRPRQILVIALLGIPPSIFFGMAGALITAMVRTQPEGSGGGVTSEKTPTQRSKLFLFVLLFSAIGYLSPFILIFKPRPKALPPPIVVNTHFTPIPKWRYQKPAAFGQAEVEQIFLSDQRMIDDLDSRKPVALSPDGLRLAYCSKNGNYLILRDLETLDILSSFEISPSALSWEANSKRLLIVTNADEKRLHVLDANFRLLDLPQPVEVRVPKGFASWWNAESVAFVTSDGKTQFLNLDTLRVETKEQSIPWKSATPIEQETILRGPPPYFFGNEKWEMKIQSMTTDYYIPLPVMEKWTIHASWQLCLSDKQKSQDYLQPAVELGEDDRMVATQDGTKLLRIRENQTTVFYFGTQARPLTTFKVEMPATPDTLLVDALAKKDVAAFVCPPLINPLNGKTVGPDRHHVKGIVRVASWNEKQAEFWVQQNNLDIKSGDVVADLHIVKDNSPQPAGALGLFEWFAVIAKPENPGVIPLRSEVSEWWKPMITNFKSGDGTATLTKIKLVSITPSLPETDPFDDPSKFSHQSSSESDVNKTLAEFIRLHHIKSSKGDVDGLVNDYAEQVDHFDHGLVDREYIRKDETEYHAPGVRLSENIVTLPVIRKIDASHFGATYSIYYNRVRPDGRWLKGYADIILQMELTSEGPRITYQRATQRDQQKGP